MFLQPRHAVASLGQSDEYINGRYPPASALLPCKLQPYKLYRAKHIRSGTSVLLPREFQLSNWAAGQLQYQPKGWRNIPQICVKIVCDLVANAGHINSPKLQTW